MNEYSSYRCGNHYDKQAPTSARTHSTNSNTGTCVQLTFHQERSRLDKRTQQPVIRQHTVIIVLALDYFFVTCTVVYTYVVSFECFPSVQSEIGVNSVHQPEVNQ